MVARAAEIHNRESICRLSRARQNCRDTTLERGNFLRHRVICRVRKARIEVARCLQVEEVGHMLGRIIFKCRRLIDGHLPGFATRG